MKRSTAIVASLLFLVVAACAKERAAHDPGVSPSEASLFVHIPAGQAVMWGGNYAKVQSTLETLAASVGPLFGALGSGGEAMSKEVACSAKLSETANAKAIGGARIVDDGVQIYFVISGIAIDEIAKCGRDAGIVTTVDADHKFVALEVPSLAKQRGYTVGYLQLPDGSLYFRQTRPIPVNTTRSVLEAEIAALNAPNAKTAASEPLLALAGKVDHAKTLWFVGNGANAAWDEMGEIYGTIDLAAGLALDVTVQVMRATDADGLAQRFAQAVSSADQLPAAYQDAVKSMRLERNGDHLRFRAALSSSQLASLFAAVGSGAAAP